MASFNPKRFTGHRGFEGFYLFRGCCFTMDCSTVPDVKYNQQGGIDECPLGSQSEGPFERNAHQKAEIERRITQWRQQATAVRDDEDEEDNHVGDVAATCVGSQ